MGVVPMRPPPLPPGPRIGGVISPPPRPHYGTSRRLRVRSWNPGAALGWACAWVFSGGRYGRLPLYWERQDSALAAGVPLILQGELSYTKVIGSRRGGYRGPQNPKPPSVHQKPVPPPAPPLRNIR